MRTAPLALLFLVWPAAGLADERIHKVPVGLFGTQYMIVTVYRPPGDEPRPLAVINHGSPGPKKRVRYRAASGWFVGRGYVVAVPTRRGYGESDGWVIDGIGRCGKRDYHAGGLGTAEDIAVTIEYMTRLPYVLPDGIVLVGQSAGGWGVIAATTMNLPGVVAAINFAGGRDGRRRCDMPRLVSDAGRYGRKSKVPMLWLYSENDRRFPPDLSRKLHRAFVAAGGVARYVQLPPFGHDGHKLFAADSGVALWSGHVAAFLGSVRR